MTTVIYDVSEVFTNRKKEFGESVGHQSNVNNIINVNFKRQNNEKSNKIQKNKFLNNMISLDEQVSQITSNAIASLLMSLEEDNLDSEHPLLTYKMIPEIYNIIERYIYQLLKNEKE